MRILRRVNQFMKTYFPTLWLTVKIAAVGAVSLVILVLLASVGFDIYGSSKLKSVRAEAAAKGVPLSIKEIIARRPVVAEKENAANLYESAFQDSWCFLWTDKPVPTVSTIMYLGVSKMTAAQKAMHDDLERITMNAGEAFPGYVLEETRAYVEKRRGVIDLICKAAVLPKCSYHSDWAGGEESTYLGRLSSAADIMCVAEWLDAEEGRAADAAAKARAGIALAASLSGEPGYPLCVYARTAAFATAISGLGRVVSRTNVSNEDLLKLQGDIEGFSARDTRRQAVEGQLATYCDAYAAVSESRTPLLSALGEGARGGLGEMLLGKTAPYVERSVGWLLRGFIKLDEAAMIKGYVAFLDNLDDPAIGSMKAADEIAGIVGKKRLSFARLAASSLPRQLSYAWRFQAQAEAAATALAALRYRNDTGKWPETLDALVPTYLEKVPVEPSDQRPFVYRILPDGIMVYSVGKNGVDDGGKPHLVEPAPNDRNLYDDIGFRIWK